MSIERKLLGTVDASSAANYIEDCFSCHLYTGTGAAQTITNGIDLATKGGLVWTKFRSGSFGTESHALIDTVRGAPKYISSDGTGAEVSNAGFTSFSTTGYVLGSDPSGRVNYSAQNYVSWTFAKQPKFFDVVTWTGNGTSYRQIAHALGSQPGMVIYKATSESSDWVVLHRSANTNVLKLNTTAAGLSLYGQYNSRFTSTYFEANKNSATYDAYSTNKDGVTYVAYLFAHDAGGFGPAGTDSVVACGSYTSNGSSQTINCGFTSGARFVLIKRTDSTGSWYVWDSSRGIVSGNDPYLLLNSAAAEVTNTDYIDPYSAGFEISSTAPAEINASGGSFVFLAIA